MGKRIPLWKVVLAAAAAAVAGFLLGSAGDREDEEIGQPRTGVVTIVDLSEGGSVCIAEPDGDDNECYHSPGRGLRVGDEVSYVVENVFRAAPNGVRYSRPVLVIADVIE